MRKRTRKVGLPSDTAGQHADSKEVMQVQAPSPEPPHQRNTTAGAARVRRVLASMLSRTIMPRLQLPNPMGGSSVEEAYFTHGFRRCEKNLQWSALGMMVGQTLTRWTTKSTFPGQLPEEVEAEVEGEVEEDEADMVQR